MKAYNLMNSDHVLYRGVTLQRVGFLLHMHKLINESTLHTAKGVDTWCSADLLATCFISMTVLNVEKNHSFP